MKSCCVVCVALFMASGMPLSAQSRGQRGRPATSRFPRSATAADSRSGGDVTTQPGSGVDSPRKGPGAAEPPVQGYVKVPESPVPGTFIPFVIADPLGIAFWELYDRAKPVTISGKVTEVAWTNPNSYIYLESASISWAVESSLIQFRQSNVTPAVRVGEVITVSGYLPKDVPLCPIEPKIPLRAEPFLKDGHLVRAGEITTVFGQKLSLGKPPTQEETEERLRHFSLGC